MTTQPRKQVPGLFVTGTDTGVGKTYVTALIARALVAAGHRVGVYKPIASGCRREADRLVSDDAQSLWVAAGQPGELEEVCPQRFQAPLAPHLAAEREGRRIDWVRLRAGLDYWKARSDVVLVEGVGGLMCPWGEKQYVADLVRDFRLPLLIVARNALGTLNHTLLTLLAASSLCAGVPVAGLVLNNVAPPDSEACMATNHQQLANQCGPPLLAEVGWQCDRFDAAVDWFALAGTLATGTGKW
jgi:dethiobiotin synthetase